VSCAPVSLIRLGAGLGHGVEHGPVAADAGVEQGRRARSRIARSALGQAAASAWPRGGWLREFLEDHRQAYVLWVPSSFMLVLNAEARMIAPGPSLCSPRDQRGWQTRSASTGFKGRR
jgi:hypothetical protein